jgi:nicotinate-nucleotide--dimethylbenzimidazole phosphoribosyltransferase
MNKLTEILDKIQPVDSKLEDKAQQRLDNLTKPQGSLGRLEELAKQIVVITGDLLPSISKKVIFTMAGDHGVCDEGVSLFPQEVTPQMVYNFIRGGAGINVLANHVGAKVVVVDMGVAVELEHCPELVIKKVDYGTKNMAKYPAMTKDQAIRSIEYGIEVFEDALADGIDIVGCGDMGIGNTTPSSAIVAAVTNAKVEDVTGRGTGIGDTALKRKIDVIKHALNIHKPDGNNGIDVLSKVGGFEIGGLCGVILAAGAYKKPVVIDGFISTAAALIAYLLNPVITQYMIAGHASVEKGHKIALEKLGLFPILDLKMRLGEGTGAVLAMSIIEAGVKIMTQMATFKEAGVSESK